jgi:hypothetical protein
MSVSHLLPPPCLPCLTQDPIFKGNKVPNPEMGYPGGIFDPLGFSKGNLKVGRGPGSGVGN